MHFLPSNPQTFHSTEEVVLAATRWLMARRARTPQDCGLARLIEKHLAWLATHPELHATGQALRKQWQSARPGNPQPAPAANLPHPVGVH